MKFTGFYRCPDCNGDGCDTNLRNRYAKMIMSDTEEIQNMTITENVPVEEIWNEYRGQDWFDELYIECLNEAELDNDVFCHKCKGTGEITWTQRATMRGD